MVALFILSVILGAHYAPEFYKKNNITNYEFGMEFPKIQYEIVKLDTEANKDLTKVKYEPNLNSMTSLTIGTKYVDIGFTVESDNVESKEQTYDKTEVFDVQFFGNWKKFTWEVYYQNYQGLYFLEDESFLTATTIPRANSFSYGASLKYYTNDKFNPKYSVGHFSWKKQSAWSFVHGIFIDKSRLESNSGTLIPTKYASEFDKIASLTAVEARALAYDFGIAGNKAFRNFYAGGLLSVGIVGQHQNLEGIDQESRYITNSTFNLMFDLGYRAKNKAGGIQVRAQSYNMPVEDTEFRKVRQTGRFYFTYYL